MLPGRLFRRENMLCFGYKNAFHMSDSQTCVQRPLWHALLSSENGKELPSRVDGPSALLATCCDMVRNYRPGSALGYVPGVRKMREPT